MCWVGGVGDEVFDDILEMAFEEHSLPGMAVGADVTDLPSAHRTPPPISLVRHKIGGDLNNATMYIFTPYVEPE